MNNNYFWANECGTCSGVGQNLGSSAAQQLQTPAVKHQTVALGRTVVAFGPANSVLRLKAQPRTFFNLKANPRTHFGAQAAVHTVRCTLGWTYTMTSSSPRAGGTWGGPHGEGQALKKFDRCGWGHTGRGTTSHPIMSPHKQPVTTSEAVTAVEYGDRI